MTVSIEKQAAITDHFSKSSLPKKVPADVAFTPFSLREVEDLRQAETNANILNNHLNNAIEALKKFLSTFNITEDSLERRRLNINVSATKESHKLVLEFIKEVRRLNNPSLASKISQLTIKANQLQFLINDTENILTFIANLHKFREEIAESIIFLRQLSENLITAAAEKFGQLPLAGNKKSLDALNLLAKQLDERKQQIVIDFDTQIKKPGLATLENCTTQFETITKEFSGISHTLTKEQQQQFNEFKEAYQIKKLIIETLIITNEKGEPKNILENGHLIKLEQDQSNFYAYRENVGNHLYQLFVDETVKLQKEIKEAEQSLEETINLGRAAFATSTSINPRETLTPKESEAHGRDYRRQKEKIDNIANRKQDLIEAYNTQIKTPIETLYKNYPEKVKALVDKYNEIAEQLTESQRKEILKLKAVSDNKVEELYTTAVELNKYHDPQALFGRRFIKTATGKLFNFYEYEEGLKNGLKKLEEEEQRMSSEAKVKRMVKEKIIPSLNAQLTAWETALCTKKNVNKETLANLGAIDKFIMRNGTDQHKKIHLEQLKKLKFHGFSSYVYLAAKQTEYPENQPKLSYIEYKKRYAPERTYYFDKVANDAARRLGSAFSTIGRFFKLDKLQNLNLFGKNIKPRGIKTEFWYQHLPHRSYKKFLAAEGNLDVKASKATVLAENKVFFPSSYTYMTTEDRRRITARFFGEKKGSKIERLKSHWFKDLKAELDLLASHQTKFINTVWDLSKNLDNLPLIEILKKLNSQQDVIAEQQILIDQMCDAFRNNHEFNKDGQLNAEFNNVFSGYINRGLIAALPIGLQSKIQINLG